jgi:hypothetical protein
MSQMTSLDKAFIFREDAALKTHLMGLKVSDLNQQDRSVKVWYGFPDVEVRQQDYPYLVIDLYDIQAANDRQMSGIFYDDTYRGTRTSDDSTTYKYEAPVLWDLMYQVTSYSRNPRHDRAIMFSMLNEKLPGKYGHLIIPDANDSGNIVARHMFLEGFVKRDQIEDGRRLLRNVFSIRVLSEMTPTQANSGIAQVQSVNTTSTTHIPAGYTPVSTN